MGGSVVTDDLWRSVTPQVIGALVRRYRDFDRAEDFDLDLGLGNLLSQRNNFRHFLE